MMTKYDPWVNILRTAMGVFAAGVGGADAITVLPFTLALGLPDDFARRIARNTQLILIHESKLAKVADPAAGAGSFEALTDELCARAWSLVANYRGARRHDRLSASGPAAKEIAVAAAARRDGHRAPHVRDYRDECISSPCRSAGQCSRTNARRRPDEIFGGRRLLPLPSRRDAEPYEILRAASDEQFRKTGERPKIFLANLGQPQGFAAAAAFATNFFAAAGIEALRNEGFETPQEAAERSALPAARSPVFARRGQFPRTPLIEAATRLRGAGATRIYLAGREPERAGNALLEAGVSELICPGSDALAILKDHSL